MARRPPPDKNGNDTGSSPTITIIGADGVPHTKANDGSSKGPKGGGGKGKGHGGGGGKDNLKAQELAANYGFAMAFLKSDKELWNLFQQATKKTWGADMFVAKLRDTKWFKRNSAPVRNAIMQKAADPATYKANVSKMGATLRDSWGKAYGIGTQGKQGAWVDYWAETAYRMGWSEAEAIDHMTKGVNYQQLLKRKDLGGTAAETREQLNQLVANFGVDLGDKWKATQLEKVLEGDGTIGGVQDMVREYAKQQYGAFANQLDAGKTMTEIADPYVQKMSELLELNPNQVGLKDGLVQRALTMKDQASGKPAGMNLNDFANSVRSDKRWQYTGNAKEQVANVTSTLLQSFGLQA
jgi:hypothetical protein